MTDFCHIYTEKLTFYIYMLQYKHIFRFFGRCVLKDVILFILFCWWLCPCLAQYRSKEDRDNVESPAPERLYGVASYYGDDFHGKCMADGRIFNKNAAVAAHRTLPLGTEVRVWRGERYVLLTITDRGPYVAGRSIDLSEGAARALGMYHDGIARVTIEVLSVPERDQKYHHINRQCLADDTNQRA